MAPFRHPPLVAAALAAASLIATPTAATAASTTGSVRVPFKSTVTVAGLSGVTGNISTTLLVPNSWKRQKSSNGRPVWFAGHGSCFYRVTTKATLSVGPSSTASARVTQDLPAVGPRVLENGTRNSFAWRVTRPEQPGRTHVRAVSALATSTRSVVTLPTGQSLWLEVWLDGLARPGSECHSGTYRQTLGPQFGDVLATVRARQFLTK